VDFSFAILNDLGNIHLTRISQTSFGFNICGREGSSVK
jgi:hypothetical protein